MSHCFCELAHLGAFLPQLTGQESPQQEGRKMKIKRITSIKKMRKFGAKITQRLTKLVLSGKVSYKNYCIGLQTISKILARVRDDGEVTYVSWYSNALETINDIVHGAEPYAGVNVAEFVGKIDALSVQYFSADTITGGLFEGMPKTEQFTWLAENFVGKDGQTIEALRA